MWQTIEKKKQKVKKSTKKWQTCEKNSEKKPQKVRN